MKNNLSDGKASKILRYIFSTLAALGVILDLIMYALRCKAKRRERRHVEDIPAQQCYTSYTLVVNRIRLVSSTLHTMQTKSKSAPSRRLRADQ
jgi:hypothetical protein